MRFLGNLAVGLVTSIYILPTVVATPTLVPESIANATALGIDIYGPIPTDAVLLPSGLYSAEPGTKAWAWIRAQIDIDPSTIPAEKREEIEMEQMAKRQNGQNSGLAIGLFPRDFCFGTALWAENAVYGLGYPTSTDMYSVGIGYRNMYSYEHLDFSKLSGFRDYCGLYVYSAGQNTPRGCFNSQRINCFRLWV